MVVAVWSAKGGAGATSVTALLALALVERADEVLVVDFCGDLPAVFGVEVDDAAPGLSDWCALDRPDSDALGRIEVPVRSGLQIVCRGTGALPHDPGHLMQVLEGSRRTVLIDCGQVADHHPFGHRAMVSATESLLVTRECFLNLRAVQRLAHVPSGVVVIKEPRRSLGRADVESAAQAPVVAEVAFDPDIARAIDAGLVAARLPRSLLRRMGQVLAHAS